MGRRVHLSRLEWIPLAAFILWISIGLVVIPGQIRLQDIDAWGLYDSPESGLRAFLNFNLQNGDVLLIALAGINTHLVLVRTWGLHTARRWGLMVLFFSTLVEIIGVRTGWPFGPYHYTAWLGPRLGGVLPLAIPFAWYVIVSNALLLVRQIISSAPWPEAAAAGLLAAAYDAVMEPFAWKIRAYWIWDTAGVPAQNYAAWGILVLLLARFLAPRTARMRDGWEFRPAVLIGSFLLLFTITRMVHGV